MNYQAATARTTHSLQSCRTLVVGDLGSVCVIIRPPAALRGAWHFIQEPADLRHCHIPGLLAARLLRLCLLPAVPEKQEPRRGERAVRGSL